MTLDAYDVSRCCEALLGDGTERLIPLLGISTEEVILYRDVAAAILPTVTDPALSTRQVLAIEATTRRMREFNAPKQRALSDLLDLAQLTKSPEQAFEEERWDRVVIPWCRGSLGSDPPLADSHAAIFEASARLYCDLMRQPELHLQGLEDGSEEWKMSMVALMVKRRYFLQFARRIRASLPDSETAKLCEWASSIVGQNVTLP